MSKVFVIGLDGGSFRVIDYLVGQNRLPNFARVLNEGSRATLMSTIPPVTPAAWASFYTSSNPGVHGVADFFSSGTYQLVPINGGAVNGHSLWELASEHGKRVCVYNVPLTYPARPVNGVLISGTDAPRLDERAIYPREFRETLLSEIPDFEIEARLDIQGMLKLRDPVGGYIRFFHNYLDLQIRVVRRLMQLEDWDLMVAVFRSTDFFQHTFWRHAEQVMSEGAEAVNPEIARKAEAVFNCYEKLDAELGERWAKWGSDRNLVFMSDHGFGLLQKEVCINKILAKAGLLTFQRKKLSHLSRRYILEKVSSRIPARGRKEIRKLLRREGGFSFADSLIADVDWSRTKIYTKGTFGCLFVNQQGREPMGIVAPGKERQSVLEAARRALKNASDPDDGLPLVSEFMLGEEIFHGPRAEQMPDAVVVLRGYACRSVSSASLELSQESIVRSPSPEWKELAHTGHHRREGMLAMYGPDIRPADLGAAEIIDVAPTVLHLLSLPPSAPYQGKVLEDGMKLRASVSAGRSGYQGAGTANKEDEPYSAEDEEEIRKRLQNLGYL